MGAAHLKDAHSKCLSEDHVGLVVETLADLG